MIDVGWISEALDRHNLGVFALSSSGVRGYVGGCCAFHDFLLVAQVARLALDMQLIEMPEK